MLPKSLDGDSAGGMVITTPPVLNTAEALFTVAPEHLTTWPSTISSSVRVSTNNVQVILQKASLLFYNEPKTFVSKIKEHRDAFEHILSRCLTREVHDG